MTIGLHEPKHADPKLTEGEVLILCEIKELISSFTTTTPKYTMNAAGFLFSKKKWHINLLTTVPPKACSAATWFKPNRQRTSRLPCTWERNPWKPEGLRSFISSAVCQEVWKPWKPCSYQSAQGFQLWILVPKTDKRLLMLPVLDIYSSDLKNTTLGGYHLRKALSKSSLKSNLRKALFLLDSTNAKFPVKSCFTQKFPAVDATAGPGLQLPTSQPTLSPYWWPSRCQMPGGCPRCPHMSCSWLFLKTELQKARTACWKNRPRRCREVGVSKPWILEDNLWAELLLVHHWVPEGRAALMGSL